MITNPAIEVLQRELEETYRQISEMTETIKSAKSKQKSLEDALSVLTGQPIASSPSRTTSDGGPTLKDQILELLTPDGMGLAPAEIAHLLTENGRETGNTTVSSTLSRMKKEGIVVKRGSKWFLRVEDKSQGGASSALPSAIGPHTHSSETAVQTAFRSDAASVDATGQIEISGTAGPEEAKAEDAGGIFSFHNPNPAQSGA